MSGRGGRPLKGLGRKSTHVSLPVEFFEPDVGEVAICAADFPGGFSGFVEEMARLYSEQRLAAGRKLDDLERRVALFQHMDESDAALVRSLEERRQRRGPLLKAAAAELEQAKTRVAGLRARYPTPEALAEAHASQPDMKLRELAHACGHDGDVVVELAAEVRARKKAPAKPQRRVLDFYRKTGLTRAEADRLLRQRLLTQEEHATLDREGLLRDDGGEASPEARLRGRGLVPDEGGRVAQANLLAVAPSPPRGGAPTFGAASNPPTGPPTGGGEPSVEQILAAKPARGDDG